MIFRYVESINRKLFSPPLSIHSPLYFLTFKKKALKWKFKKYLPTFPEFDWSWSFWGVCLLLGSLVYVILRIAIFVIWVNYADGITISWNCVVLVILFQENWYLPENTGLCCLKKLGVHLSLNHYKMFCTALMINMKWRAFLILLERLLLFTHTTNI